MGCEKKGTEIMNLDQDMNTLTDELSRKSDVYDIPLGPLTRSKAVFWLHQILRYEKDLQPGVREALAHIITFLDSLECKTKGKKS